MISLALWLAVSGGAAASGVDWDAAFSPGLFESHVIAEARVVVVAGSTGSDGEVATAALARTAASSKRVSRVVVPGGLDSLAQLDDRAIVERLRTRTIDQVWIVRVSPAETGVRAVVTLYAVDGTLAGGFSVTALPPGASQAPAARAAQTDQGPAAGAGAARNPREEFLRRFVHYDLRGTYDPRFHNQIMTLDGYPLKGEQNEPLEGPALYEYIGRKDLADQYRTKRLIRGAVLGTSVAVAAVGAWVFASRPACTWRWTPIGEDCSGVEGERSSKLTISIASVAVAVAGFLYFGLSTSHPVPWSTRKGLIDDYNQKLGEELGVVLVRDEEPPPPPEPTRYALEPWATGDGGGLSLRVDL